MVIFTITAVCKLWYIVWAYIPPNDQLTVHWVEQALARGPARVDKLLVGDLNACLLQLRDQQEEDLATVIVNYRLVDQSLNFIPRWRYIEKVCWSGMLVMGWGC